MKQFCDGYVSRCIYMSLLSAVRLFVSTIVRASCGWIAKAIEIMGLLPLTVYILYKTITTVAQLITFECTQTKYDVVVGIRCEWGVFSYSTLESVADVLDEWMKWVLLSNGSIVCWKPYHSNAMPPNDCGCELNQRRTRRYIQISAAPMWLCFRYRTMDKTQKIP